MKRLKVALVDLDGQTAPGWVEEALVGEGIELVIRDCKTRAELAECAKDAEVVWLFGGSRILQDGNLDAVPGCRAILRTGSGTDNVPVEAATRRGIMVANTPAAFSDGVSDHVIALLFTLIRRVAALDRAVRAGRWEQARLEPVGSLQGRTLGLIGFGHVGRMVTQKLSGFNMTVLVYDPYVSAEVLSKFGGIKMVDLKQLLADADLVSLHCPLTPETKHLIGAPELHLMKPGAILLNTSRGAVIDETALVQALREGRIAAAGLDVLEDEPPRPDNPLLHMENVVVTPHVAGYSADGITLRWHASIATLLAMARNQPPPSWVNQGPG
jgi:D-3-phosphoglycerate dehydrogenase